MIAEHLLIALPAAVVGLALGSGLGYATALAARSLLARSSWLRDLSRLNPWRTVMVTLLLTILYIPWIAPLTGLSRLTGMLIVGLFTALLALPLTTGAFLGQWYPSVLAIQLLGLVRTLISTSIVVAVVTAPMGSIGGLAHEFFARLQYPGEAWPLFWLVFFLTLTVDLLIGLVEVYVVRRGYGFSAGSAPPLQAVREQ